jgi:hypothetical protein
MRRRERTMTEQERLELVRVHLEEALDYLNWLTLPDAVDHIGAALAVVRQELGDEEEGEA